MKRHALVPQPSGAAASRTAVCPRQPAAGSLGQSASARRALGRLLLTLLVATGALFSAGRPLPPSHAVSPGLTSADWQALQALLPPSHQAYLKASNTGAGDYFGYSVAISDDTVVVGAPEEDSAATGVDGDQANNGAATAGAAYVFVRTGSGWSQQAYLKASNTGAGDYFGFRVAIAGDTVVIGAPQEDSSTIGVNSTPNEAAALAGAAYVFTRSGTTWSQQAYLKASNTGAGDRFGVSVAVADDTVVIGAHREDSAATGVDGDQTNNSASAAGAAYVFVRSGSTWAQEAYLKASNTDADDFFGESVAIAGDTAVVGAVYEASAAIGVNGDQTDNRAFDAGAAYVFTRSGSTWSQQAYLKASNTWQSYEFSISVAIDADTIVVGSASEASAATGVNGNQTDRSASNAGAAYVFVRDGSTWSQQAYLKASNTDAGDYFGFRVAVSGATILVGAPLEASAATGVNGDQANNSAPVAGAAYLFAREGTVWSQQAYLKASNTEGSDFFGFGAAFAGETIVAAAPQEDSAATGVNGNQASNSAASAGAVYVIAADGDLPTPTPATPTATATMPPTTPTATAMPTATPSGGPARTYLPLIGIAPPGGTRVAPQRIAPSP